MCEVLINILGTVLGGLCLTFILFVLNEYFFRNENLTGEWITCVKITKTSYKPFENLVVEYKIHLIQKGHELSGSGEKVKEIKPNGEEIIFKRENRVLIDIEGYFEKRYLRKSKIYLNIEEEGRKRETRATYFLSLDNDKALIGTFISTAADASGSVRLNRT
ncbi:MAG: hypothetical protein QM734_14510 [Cyclobacteriaceae bacterium]